VQNAQQFLDVNLQEGSPLMPWSTPLKVRNHLLRAIDQRLKWPNTSIWPPQASRGVYIVTERLWNGYAYPNPNLVGPPKIRSSAMLGRALHGIPPNSLTVSAYCSSDLLVMATKRG
jgi:hypothetical protein